MPDSAELEDPGCHDRIIALMKSPVGQCAVEAMATVLQYQTIADEGGCVVAGYSLSPETASFVAKVLDRFVTSLTEAIVIQEGQNHD